LGGGSSPVIPELSHPIRPTPRPPRQSRTTKERERAERKVITWVEVGKEETSAEAAGAAGQQFLNVFPRAWNILTEASALLTVV